MCLDRGFKQVRNDEKSGIGWKVYNSTKNNKLTANMCGNVLKTIPRNRWLNEKDYRHAAVISPPEGYGYHIFLNKEDAIDWAYASQKILMVKYRNATYIGRFNDSNNIVAKEILILPNQKS